MATPYKTITSANAILTLGVVGLYDVPQTIQGFAPDEAFATQALKIGESVVGVDGYVGHGYVFNIVPLDVTLIPTSPSSKFFDDWIAAANAVREVLPCFGTIKYPSIGKQVTMGNGWLESHPGIVGAKKVLDNLKYVINFSSKDILVSDY